MHLHSVIISFNRLELTKTAIASYFETVTVPFTLVVADNASTDGTREFLTECQEWYNLTALLLPENRFPGYACNRGWEEMPPETTHLHRADNDFRFLPGWCETFLKRFGPKIGQVGLRTAAEEQFAPSNVGGNNVILRKLWDEGLRYDERPWGEEYPKGYTEDSLFTPAVKKLGWGWTRVKKPAIVSLSREDPDDPYYQETWRLRGIDPPT